MYLTILNKIFGILPLTKQSTLSVPLLCHSTVLVTMTMYSFILRVCRIVEEMQTDHEIWDKHFLEAVITFLRISTWMIHLTAFIRGDTLVVDLPSNKRSIIEPTMTVMTCIGFPVYGTITSCKTFGPICLFLSILGGLCRANEFLIVIQFVGILEKLMKFYDFRVSSSINDSIIVQKHVMEKARKLNDLYKVQLLCCTGTFFASLSIDSYFMLSRLTVQEDPTSEHHDSAVYFTILEISQFSVAFYWLLRIVGSCEKFYQKMEILNDRIYNSMKRDENLKANVKLQLYVMKKPTVIFTAYRFYPIGYPLITSVIGAAATYLVILLQFPDGD